jgi:hypothetical protein
MKWLLIAMIVIPGTIADVLNTMGMKRNGQGLPRPPGDI